MGPLVCAGLLDGCDLVEHLEVPTGQERSPVNDHVDLVRTGAQRVAGVRELDLHRGPAGREGGRHRRHVDVAAPQGIHGYWDHVGVDADCRDLGRGGVTRVWGHRLGAQ